MKTVVDSDCRKGLQASGSEMGLSELVVEALTTHSTKLAIVGRWQRHVGVVVTVEAHPQAKGCLQDNELSTQVDFNSSDGVDRGDDRCPVDLQDTDICIQIGQEV